YPAAVSMWFTPAESMTASVSSARSWLMRPSAAAPKIARVDRCPVRPNTATGSMRRPYAMLQALRGGVRHRVRAHGKRGASLGGGPRSPRKSGQVFRAEAVGEQLVHRVTGAHAFGSSGVHDGC